MSALTQTLLAALPGWGPYLIALTTFLSCLLLPVPASLLLIAAGAFVASDDLTLVPVVTAALTGFLVGDQIAFSLGRGARSWLGRQGGRRAVLIARAQAMLAARGGLAVFLSRWLFSPLGPWMTLAAGAAGFARGPFTLASLSGAAIWATIYLGLGLGFGANLQAAADLAGTALGLLAAVAVTGALGWWLVRAARGQD